MEAVKIMSVYKRKANRSIAPRIIKDSPGQPDDLVADRRTLAINTLEEIKFRVNESIRTLDTMNKIYATVQEDIKDHLQVIDRSNFEDIAERREILDSLRLSNDLYREIGLAILRLTSSRF